MDFANAASDYFWEMDADLRFSYFSARYEEIIGIAPQAVVGKTREEVWREHGLSIDFISNDAWAAHAKTLTDRRSFRDVRVKVRRPDGEARTIAVSGEPVLDDEGRFLGYRGAGWDITEQVRAQEEAVAARSAAERANESKSRFLAQIGHELRTPLNAILGFSEVIKDEILGPIGQPIYTDYGKHIHESGCYLLGLIDDLLDMSKLQAGKFELHDDTLVLPEMLMAVVHTIEPLAAKKELRFGVDIPVDLPHLRADDRAVRQMVINLLSNAVKFTPEAGEGDAEGSRRGWLRLPDGRG